MKSSQLITTLLAVAVLTIMIACDTDKGPSSAETGSFQISSTPSVSLTPEPGQPEPIQITIGNLTDLTGPGANAMSYATMALEDMVAYYNENHVIPGIEFKVVTFDGQFDPSQDIPGYEWLKKKGADVIISPVPSAAVILKPFLEEDGITLFALSPTEQAIDPPGYVISPANVLCRPQSYTLLRWIAENDPDFPRDRPARIGGAFWAESYGASLLAGAKEYARLHPDQYEWKGSHLTGITFNWAVEVEALRNCDYVIPPVPMTQFVEQYRNAGYKAKFVGFDAHLGFLGMIDTAGLWEEVEGMIFIKPGQWWNDEGQMMDLARELLNTRRAGESDSIMKAGVGYQAINGIYVMFELIADAMEQSPPGGFTPQAVYDAAADFSVNIDGCIHRLNSTRRVAADCVSVYELRAGEKDIFRLNDGWITVVTDPAE